MTDILFKKSFASHEKSKYWSDKNGDVKPRNVFKGTDKKYIFDCNECNHDFTLNLDAITGKRNRWCPYCSNRKLCIDIDCTRCYEKSFASHKKSKYWSDKNGDVKPRNVFKGTGKKYIFDCNEAIEKIPKDYYKNILEGAYNRKMGYSHKNKTRKIRKKYQ
jgi:DNA-directed RNA polymerase subunit RPC12/RpoP